MAFDLEKPTECERCSDKRVRHNVLTPRERMILCHDFIYCPYCGRKLQTVKTKKECAE